MEWEQRPFHQVSSGGWRKDESRSLVGSQGFVYPSVLNNSSAVYWDGRPCHSKVGRKVGLLCPFPWRAGFPSNTMSPGPRPTSLPSDILIHPADSHKRHGPKSGGETAVPLPWGEGGGSPPNTISPGPRQCYLSCKIFSVWISISVLKLFSSFSFISVSYVNSVSVSVEYFL